MTDTANITLLSGDCRVVLKDLPANSVDSVVCDPPYELGFMGKSWDASGVAYDNAVWAEVFRVLKPGGHLLSCGGSRTYHRMACAIEDAGFEIRDQIMWVYGSGFPKSLDVSKAIDKAAGAEREVVGPTVRGAQSVSTGRYGAWGEGITPTVPSTDEAKEWDGWGTALKPAHEPIVVARKPIEGTVAQTVMEWGTGAINIDGCRVPSDDGYEKAWDRPISTNIGAGKDGNRGNYISDGNQHRIDISANKPVGGRFPANFIHDGSDEVVALFPHTAAGNQPAKRSVKSPFNANTQQKGADSPGRTDAGSAARFFYCAKANKNDRNEGLDDFALVAAGGMKGRNDGSLGSITMNQNHHPTVKPTELMRYLCRMVTRPGGTVLDPFCGSGSTGKAAVYEGFNFIGIEQNDEYLAIARARIDFAVRSVGESR